MRAPVLLLALAAAGAVAGAAAGSEPAWRKADNHRALEIGLTAKDVGPGWAATAASPRTVDVGSVFDQQSAALCTGPNGPTKADTDLVVSGASMSTFTRGGGEVVSLVTLFKTPTLARNQMVPAAFAGLKRCFTIQLKHGLALPGVKTSVTSPYHRLRTTSTAISYDERLIATIGNSTVSEMFYFDVLAEQSGRGIVETVFLSPGRVPSAALERRVSSISSARLARYAA